MQKLLIALLVVMLVVTVVLGSLGIAYSKNDFVGTILTVEHGLGKVSKVCLSLFNKAKEFFLSGVDLFANIYDATIGRFINWIEDKFNFDLLETIGNAFNEILNAFRTLSLIFEYIGEYGWNLFNTASNKEASVFISCLNSSEFFEDFEHRKGFLWNKFEKYRDAYLYGADNEYSYLVNTTLSKGIFDYVSKVPASTVFIGYQWSVNQKISAENCALWFTTVDLFMPEDYLSFVPLLERIDRYYNAELPVYDTNITYTYHDYDCTLVAIRLCSPRLDGTDGSPSYNGSSGTFLVFDNMQCGIDFIFSYYNPAGKASTISISLHEFIQETKSSYSWWNYPNVAHPYDDLYIPE